MECPTDFGDVEIVTLNQKLKTALNSKIKKQQHSKVTELLGKSPCQPFGSPPRNNAKYEHADKGHGKDRKARHNA